MVYKNSANYNNAYLYKEKNVLNNTHQKESHLKTLS